jgi:Skp family chaperone for outer membrane proteins
MNINKAGWLAAALLAAGIVGAGFQKPGDKVGTVDMEKVFNDSAFAKTQTDNLKTMGSARQGVLEFVNTYKTISAADANKFRELSLKDNATAADKAEVERIKGAAQASEQKYRELSTKTSPTPDELKQVDDFAKRTAASEQLLQQWQQDFMNEVQAKQASLRSEALGKVRTAIQKVGKDQGYSIIFDSSVAPFSANDLTDDAMKAMK